MPAKPLVEAVDGASGELISMRVTRLQAAGLAVIGLGASIAPLDFAVNIAFPAITAAFALETRAIRWVAVCYVLVYGSLMLASGALGDRIGHLRVFRAGLLLAAIAFTLCAIAPSYAWLLAARVLQGVAVALTLSCAPALATALFDEARRTWALAVFGGMGAIAGVIAPVAGGASMAALGWAGVYWFRVPIVVIAFVCVPLLARGLSARAALAAGEHPARLATQSAAFDAKGMTLLALGMALLLLAPALWSMETWLWQSLPLALGGAALITFFVMRERASTTPFLPHAVARDPDFIWPNMAAVVVQATSFAVPLLLPYYLTRVAGWSPLASGVLLSCWSIGALAGAGLAPPLVRVLGVRRSAFAGGLLVAAGLATIALWPLQPLLALMMLCLLLQGAGLGIFQVAYTDLVVAALPPAQRGLAGSLTMVTRTVGIVLSVSLLTWILQNGEAAALAQGGDARAAFMAGFRAVFVWMTVTASVCFALTSLRRSVWFERMQA